MAQVFNWETNQVEERPDSVVTQLVAEGTHSLPKGQVDVITPSGKHTQIDAEKTSRFFQKGYHLETGAERTAREREEKFGDQATLAGLAGAARGLSFGLSDVGLTKSGLVEEETLSALRELNPTASMIGEGAATVGAVLATGGLGAGAAGAATAARGAGALGRAAQVARGLGAPVRAVSRLGAAAETVAGKTLTNIVGKHAAGTAGKAAAKAVGAGLEGIIYGAGQGITEEALNAGNTEKTAEEVMASIGLSALAGGALGAGLGAGTSVFGDLVSGTGKLTGKQIGKLWEATQEGGGKLGKKTGKFYAKLSSALGAGNEEDLAALYTDPALRKMAVEGGPGREAIQRGTRELIDESGGHMKAVKEMTLDSMKADKVAKIVRKGNEQEVLSATVGNVDQMLNQVDGMLADPNAHGFVRKLRAARKNILAYKKSVDDIVENTPRSQWNAKLAESTNSFKSNFEQFSSLTGGKSIADDETAAALRAMYKENVVDLSENAALWGDEVAGIQRFQNSMVKDYMDNERFFARHFVTKAGKEGGDVVYTADPTKLNTYFKNIGTPRMDLRDNVIREHIQRQRDIAKNARAHFNLDETHIKRIEALEQNAKKLESFLDEGEKSISAYNKLQELAATEGIAGTLIGSQIGSSIGDLFGASALGAAASALTRPAQTLRQLVAVETMASRFSKRVSGAVRKYGEVVAKQSPKARRTMVPGTLAVLNSANYGSKGAPRDRKEEAFADRINELHKAAANPDAVAEQVAGRLGGVGNAAPKIAEAVTRKAVQAVGFLAEKAPKNPNPPNVLVKQPWRPAASEMDKFARYVEAVENPAVVLERLEDQTLTREHVEGLKAVYPDVYADMQTQVAETLAEQGDDTPYSDRVQLALLFDVPVDATMEPGFIARTQQMFQQQAGTEEGGQGQPIAAPSQRSVVGIRNLTVPERSQTPAQRLQA